MGSTVRTLQGWSVFDFRTSSCCILLPDYFQVLVSHDKYQLTIINTMSMVLPCNVLVHSMLGGRFILACKLYRLLTSTQEGIQ